MTCSGITKLGSGSAARRGSRQISGHSVAQAEAQPAPEAVPIRTTSQVMGPDAIRAYTGEKINGKNWGAFEFGFTAHLIGYGLLDTLSRDVP
ncbi:hypothetical protein BVRB_037770, partial [Beta vulgaris subsp. vulgaris]